MIDDITWLDLFFEASTEESVVGASRHLLYIGRKHSSLPGRRR